MGIGTGRKAARIITKDSSINVFQVRWNKYGIIIRVKFGYECFDSAYLQSNVSEIHLFVADLFQIALSAIGSPR